MGLKPRKADLKNPRKNEEKESSKEHLITESELFAAFKGKGLGGFSNRIGFHRDEREEIPEQAPIITETEKTEINEAQIGLQKEAVAPEVQLGLEEAAPLASAKELEIEKQESVHGSLMFTPVVKSPDFKRLMETADELEKDSQEKKAKLELEKIKLDEREQQLLTSLFGALHAGDEQKLHYALEELALFRSEDESRCQNDAPLNAAIRQRVVGSFSAELAYKNGKDVMRDLQFLDMLNLEIESADFRSLPSEVLKLPELQTIAKRYLVWCAKEYMESPIMLSQKVTCFVGAGVLSEEEVHNFVELQEVITRFLLDFAKVYGKNPLEIERKIYQYSLTGLIDGKKFKQNEKLKEVAKKFLLEYIGKYQDRPEELNKKIKDYEHIGLLNVKDLREDKRISQFLEKYLTRYAKANQGHPRKISMRVKEYFDIGLIDKELKEKCLK